LDGHHSNKKKTSGHWKAFFQQAHGMVQQFLTNYTKIRVKLKKYRNLTKYARNPKNPDRATRPDNAGRCRKQVIAVLDDGRWVWFPYLGAAAEWIGGNRENVGRCCRMNQAKKVCKHNWRPGQPKGANPINTDHKYKGIRFYFESDNVWTTKVNS
jgi:hypothetical protein